MKVNHKTHPILEKLERRSLGVLPVYECDKAIVGVGVSKMINESFKRSVDFFKTITYVSKEYYDASLKVREKLALLMKDIVLNCIDDIHINGTFIVQDKVCFIKENLYKDSEEHHMVFMCFNKAGMPLAYYETGIPGEEGTFIWVSNIWGIKRTPENIQAVVGEMMGMVGVIHLFKSYAQVETKFVAAKSDFRSGLSRYQNDTGLNITYLTSKWFTNIVRTQGFNVSGHFRLQPKKVNGEWTKELIWINPFEKHGYRSRAGILNKEGQNAAND